MKFLQTYLLNVHQPVIIEAIVIKTRVVGLWLSSPLITGFKFFQIRHHTQIILMPSTIQKIGEINKKFPRKGLNKIHLDTYSRLKSSFKILAVSLFFNVWHQLHAKISEKLTSLWYIQKWTNRSLTDQQTTVTRVITILWTPLGKGRDQNPPTTLKSNPRLLFHRGTRVLSQKSNDLESYLSQKHSSKLFVP